MADEHQDQATGPTGAAAAPVPPLGPNGPAGSTTQPISPTGPTGWEPQPPRRPASAFESQGTSYAPPSLPLSARSQISLTGGPNGSIRPASHIVELKVPTGRVSDDRAVEFPPGGADDVIGKTESGTVTLTLTANDGTVSTVALPAPTVTVQHSPDVVYSPTVELQTAAVDEVAVAVDEIDATVIRAAPASIGTATLANRDSILIQSLSVQLLLKDAIDRAKAERLNSASVSELEEILSANEALHRMLLTTTSLDAVGETALSLRAGLVKWLSRDPASILDRGYDFGLFTAVVGICVLAGVIPSAIAAVLVRPKETVEILKEINKFLGRTSEN
jgi:hypothetical protein